MKQMQADVIVVAAGPAGLAAAIEAADAGLNVIVFEKSNTAGGAANMGMGPLGINTSIQRSNFNDITVPYALGKHMEYTHYRVDEGLVSRYFNLSADTIDWLIDMGVNFAGAFRYSRDSEATWHIVKPDNGPIGPRCASAMIKKMNERAAELGVDIYLETPVYDLIQSEDGTVTGVKAKDKDGEEIEAAAKAVVVCTGGFGTNPEMMKKELGLNLGEDLITFMIPGIVGDGLNMMWKAGAEKYGTNIEMIYCIRDQINYMALDMLFRQGVLFINRDGDRFMNESVCGNTTFTGNAISTQPGKFCWSIVDDSVAKFFKRNGFTHISLVEPEALAGNIDGAIEDAVDDEFEEFVIAETIEEFAEKMNIPVDKLQDTLDTYNDYCEQGFDEDFAKERKDMLPVYGKGHYMAIKFHPAAYGTVGGVHVNRNCEVLDNKGNPIPGLYSAGSDANTIYGDSYNFKLPGNTMGFAINSGRIAGQAIADKLADA